MVAVSQLEKQCTQCGATKPIEGFHRNHRMSDGRMNQCKGCRNSQKIAWNRANPELRAAADVRYRELHRKEKAERARLRRTRDPRCEVSAIERWAERNPEKIKAQHAVHNAVQRGKLVKPNCCEDCNEPVEKAKLHGHHEDYGKPLDIEWLCPRCHGRKHSDGRR